MKEYERQVFWLDYFSSELKRSEGRRVPLSIATRAPTLQELEEACRRLGLQPIPAAARRPGASWRASGYVSVVKTKPKAGALVRIARTLATVRGDGQKGKPPGQKKHEAPAKT